MNRRRSVLVGLAVALLAGSLAFAQRGAVPFSQENAPLDADLAFVEPQGRVAWLPAGDATVRLLGRSSVRYAFPLFSPDGSRLAAIERSDGAARAVVFELAGAASADIRVERTVWFERAGTSVIYLDWQDDGQALRVLTGTPQGLSLHVASAGEVRGPWATGAPIYWDEGPDGLVVHVGGPGGSRLLRLADDGSIVDVIDDAGAFRSPAISPSGRWLAFGERLPGDVRRTVIERQPGAGAASDGADRRSLDVRGLAAFAWHPERDLLALTRPFEDTPFSFGPLGGLDASSGMFEAWTDAPVVAFWWSPDGSSIGLLSTPAPSGGRFARARPLQARPLQAQPLQLRLGLLAPSSGDVAWLGTVRPQRSFLDQSLPFFDQYARSHAVWSPDGRWLALSIVDPEGRDVVGLLDVRTGEMRALAPGSAPTFAPR